MQAPSPNFLREFVATMPRAYRYAFEEADVLAHARVVAERTSSVARVGRFQSSRDLGAEAIVVVADDRPGLLALISAALVMNDLDVVHAEAYTRQTPLGRAEAVDVFWVRNSLATPAKEIADEKLNQLQVTLVRLIEGKLDPHSAKRKLKVRSGAPASPAYETRIRFVEDEGGGLTVLEVETIDRSGLLLALAGALAGERVQIVRSEVHTEGSQVRDRFAVVELDGSPIRPDRRLALQVAVLSAIGSTQGSDG